MTVTFCILIINEWEFLLFHSYTTILVLSIFWTLAVLIDMWWYIIVVLACNLLMFLYVYLTSVYLLWWGVFQIFCSSFKLLLLLLLLNFKSPLHILAISPRSDMCFIVFLPVCDLTFHSLSSIICGRNLNLTESHLLVLSLMEHAFGIVSEKSLPNSRYSRFLSLSSSSFFFLINFLLLLNNLRVCFLLVLWLIWGRTIVIWKGIFQMTAISAFEDLNQKNTKCKSVTPIVNQTLYQFIWFILFN